MSEFEVSWDYVPPDGRKWCLCVYNGHYYIGQWEPKLDSWYLEGVSVPPPTKEVCWMRLPPHNSVLYDERIY